LVSLSLSFGVGAVGLAYYYFYVHEKSSDSSSLKPKEEFLVLKEPTPNPVTAIKDEVETIDFQEDKSCEKVVKEASEKSDSQDRDFSLLSAGNEDSMVMVNSSNEE